jgi:hypothetical protein
MIGIMNNLSGILNIACAISVQFPFFNADYDVKLVKRNRCVAKKWWYELSNLYALSLYIIIIIIIIIVIVITTTTTTIIIITIITIIIVIITYIYIYYINMSYHII